jgi:predicted dehydrogenase
MENNRREFIKNTTGALAANFLLPSFTKISAGTKDKLGVCLVGLGNYSTTNLAPALLKTRYCKLTAIVTGSEYKIPQWQKQYGIADKNVYNYSNMHHIANNPDIDVVYIVLPNGLHAKFAVMAANMGKHVWCEKPMAMTAMECKAVIDACKKNKVKLSIGYRMRHEPYTQQMKQWAKDKTYGQLQSLRSEVGWNMSPDFTWRMTAALGGGYLYDLGIYCINSMRFVAGEEVVAVTARHVTSRPEIFTEVSEETYFTLEFKSGLLGKGKSTCSTQANFLRAEAKNGWSQLEPFMMFDNLKLTTSDNRFFKNEPFSQEATQMDDDALAILKDIPMSVPGEEGMKDVQILEAINLSAKLNETILL